MKLEILLNLVYRTKKFSFVKISLNGGGKIGLQRDKVVYFLLVHEFGLVIQSGLEISLNKGSYRRDLA